MSTVQSAIAISDLHLGTSASYLHVQRKEYTHNRQALLKLLNLQGPQEELIINGDFLDLVLGGYDDVYRDVRAFFELIAESGPYRRIVYIPGNHDHHFWRSLVEIMSINGSIRKSQAPPSSETFPNCFVDARFSSFDAELAYDIPLVHFWPVGKLRPEIVVKYPHHLIRIPKNSGDESCYLFTHGHYLEPLFKPFNFLISPAQLEELEAFNNLWLEAFNYHIGHAGQLSKKVFKLLDSYERGGKRETKKLRDFINSGHHLFTNLFKLNRPKALLLKCVLKYNARKLTFEGKSKLYQSAIDDNLKYDIAHYINKYILPRYKANGASQPHFPWTKDIPTPFTFVFGHTHRPILEEDREYARIHLNGEVFPILNTGGWLRFAGDKELQGASSGVLAFDELGARWESLENQLQ